MVRMPLGSRLREALIAACTSRAAASTLRPISNRMMIRVLPWALRLVISLMPAMLPSARSSGVATLEAMVCGLAPGRLALTTMAGKSMFGSGATDSRRKLTSPARMIARLSSRVATGRRMKGAERFMGSLPPPLSPQGRGLGAPGVGRGAKAPQQPRPLPRPLSRKRARGAKARRHSRRHP